MTKKSCIYSCLLLLAVLFAGCSTVKYVPQDKELLKKVRVKSDVKDITPDYLMSYLHQTPNNYFLGFWRLQLDFYNASGEDSTKWINRWLRRIGEPPVIYDSLKTVYSEDELKKVLFNKGYINADVSSEVTHRKRQVKVLYNIKGNEPYRLRNYVIALPDDEALELISRGDTTERPHAGMLFDTDLLNRERERIVGILRNRGYYNFRKELLFFSVDSALGSHRADVELSIQPSLLDNDSALDIIFKKKLVENVTIIALKDGQMASDIGNIGLDTTYREGYCIITDPENKTFRPEMLVAKTHILPNSLYNERLVDRTYARLGRLNAVKYVNVSFHENVAGNLDAVILVTQDKPHTFSAEIEGTYSDGDLGVGLGIGYQNNNIFRGSETLSINVNGGYEAIGSLSDVQSAWDGGGSVSLTFPQLLVPSKTGFRRKYNGDTEISVSVNFQQRPEYQRNIANAGFRYNWQHRRIDFSYNLIDISYIYLPRMSDEFRDKYMSPSSSIRYSYEDHFIMRMGFGISYSNQRYNNQNSSYFTLRADIRTAGNLLYGMSHLFNQPRNEEGHFEIFNINYSQYVKGEVNYAYNLRLEDKARLVFHAGLGVAVPYGNATIMPFEERFFSGGASSMRGWSARTLGPGNFHNNSGSIDFMKQSGDVKLDLNIEARFKIFWKLHGALFLDAGNIWTTREYPEQPTGLFRFDTFYKQLAFNYGAGLRLDFDFFVIRVDMGVKLFDPGFPIESQRWRTKPTWKNDFAFHFAVGYPF